MNAQQYVSETTRTSGHSAQLYQSVVFVLLILSGIILNVGAAVLTGLILGWLG